MQAQDRTRAFAELHAGGCFVMPNPWDRGSAHLLQALGFPALASTSAGFAFSRALPDSPDVLSGEEVIAHVAELVAATSLPVNADFQSGYADQPEGVADNVTRLLATGVSGLSIEDAVSSEELFALDEALERLSAARAAIDAAGSGVLLTGRAECFLTGHPDPLREAVRRLQAYGEAGADVLFAPGVREPRDIRAIVQAVAPKPVNVLVSSDTGVTVSDLAELGVRRVSVGSALARVAWGAFLGAARALAVGSFAGLRDGAPFSELNELFSSAAADSPAVG